MIDQQAFAQEISALLAKNKVISAAEAENLQKGFSQSSHDWFVEFLLEESLVDKEEILKALSSYYQVPSFDVAGYFFDHLLVRDFPKDFLLRNNIIPVEIDEDILMIAASDPSNEDLLPRIKKIYF